MNKLRLDFKNCFGIDKLEHEFDFSNSRAVAIYAPNGVMKTSFAKTFKAVSEGKDPEEQLFGNISECEILTDGIIIDKDEIVVIKSFENKITAENSVTTLLVDEESKSDYDIIYTDILKKKSTLISKLNRLSGEKQTDIENKVLIDFNFNNTDFFKFLSEIKFDEIDYDLSQIKYKEIFESDVVSFVKNPEVKKNIDEYTEKYNSLLEHSKYFKKGVFNPTKADNVLKTLSKENFFKANHKIKLSGDDDEILDEEVFKMRLEEERKEILENAELVKIENEIKKVSVVRFREILEEANYIIPELENLEELKKKLWNSYLAKEREFIEELIKSYSEGKERLEEIEKLAFEQRTSWEDIIDKFKARFFVPFNVDIKNKSNVVLGKSAPNISFSFQNPKTGELIEMKKEKIDEIELLSQGERRAMYLLNVMFNIEARKKEDKKTLFIIDDIADSFDYKNKYAIIQYLKDISNEPLFFQIILTHNFDFFRSIQSRNICNYNNMYLSFKSTESIRLEPARGIKNPFINDWKINLNNSKKLIASIPFVRNIIEYTEGEAHQDYNDLTSILHWKEDTETKLLSDLEIIFANHFNGINFNSPIQRDKKVVDIIFEEAENCLLADEGINLENKLVLSISIRLKAEQYMWSKITDKTAISGSQTGKLFGRFKNEFRGTLDNEIKILDEVNLITPENIHLNSFMFEPILDLSDMHLKNLYKRIKAL